MSAPPRFAVSFVDGVTLDKWRRRWTDRVPGTRLDLTLVDDAVQLDGLRAGDVSMAFVRDLGESERDGLHHIPLYVEVPVVVVHSEHPVAAYDEIPLADLVDEVLLDDPGLTTQQRVETVAAGTGIVLLPMSVARAHHRKDVVAVPLTGGVESQVGLAWLRDADHPLLDTFVGIVRGRTQNSSRTTSQQTAQTPKKTPSKPARKTTSQGPARRGTARPRRQGGRGHRG